MFIKRAKSRPSIRARDADDAEPSNVGSPLAKSSVTADEEGGDGVMEVDEGGLGSVMERKKAQRKDKVKKMGSGGGRLSFGGDGDEGEGFKPRKSLLSQSIKLPTAASPQAGPSRPTNGTPSYSNDYLAELKASTPSRAPRNAEVVDVDDADEEGLSSLARQKYAGSLAEDTTAGIPDTAAIANAKAKRQAALSSAKYGGKEEDYISLGDGRLVVHDGADGPHPESRLMREDDEGDEGDEDLADYTESKDTLYIGKNQTKAAARRQRGELDELIADREAEDEDDEETREWEEAQARRAGKYEAEEPEAAPKREYIPAPSKLDPSSSCNADGVVPRARPIPTPTAVQARVAKALAEAQARKEEDEHMLETATKDLAILDEQEQDIRKEVERIERKREWMEEFRGWVEMLGSFLEEKIPKLDDIEADALHHLKERSDIITKRRSADDSDDLSLFLGVPKSTDEPEVDDLGRAVPSEAGPSSGVRRARREDRITRRKRRAPKPVEDDGLSTDDELAQGDQEDLSTAQQALEKRVGELGEDVRAEDFRDPEKGLAVRFGDWREKYPDDYTNAFGGLSMVQAWAFWARGEMVGWEPLRGNKPLLAFAWFTALYDYSRRRPPPINEDDMEMDEEPPLGPDGDLVVQMISDAVVPWLIKAMENGAYDPYSAKQTRGAVDLLELIQELAGHSSRKFADLLKAVMQVFSGTILDLQNSIADCISPGAIPPPAFDPASRPATQRYLTRRLKLLRNLLLWKRLAPTEVRELVNTLVERVVMPVLLRTWDGGGSEISAKAAQKELGPIFADFLQRGPRR